MKSFKKNISQSIINNQNSQTNSWLFKVQKSVTKKDIEKFPSFLPEDIQEKINTSTEYNPPYKFINGFAIVQLKKRK